MFFFMIAGIFYLCLFLVIIIPAIWLLSEPYFIQIKNIKLTYSNLPKEFEGFSVLFLSDIHTAKWGFLEELLSEKLASVPECDICVLGGDLAFTENAAENIPKLLSNAKIKGDTYAVFGNTEYKPHNNPENLKKIYRKFGYKILENEFCEIEKEHDRIIIGGADDPINQRDDLKKTFENCPKDLFRILVSHCPSVAPESLDYGVNLVLAGHTHGGQVKLPFCTVYTHMIKNKFLNRGIWYGKKLEKKLKRKADNFYLIVSNGIGTSKLWIRFMAPPQIIRIKLTGKK